MAAPRTVLALTLLGGLLACPAALRGQTPYGTTVALGATFATGTYSQFFKPGIQASAGFYYGMEENLRLQVLVGYVRNVLDSKALTDNPDVNYNKGTYDVAGSVSGFPLLIGLQLVPPKQGTRMYGLLEAGLYLMTRKFEGGTFTYPDGSVSTYQPSSVFKAEPGFNVGVGVLLPVASDKSLDVAFRYHLVKDSQYYNLTPDGGSASYVGFDQYLSLSVGLSYDYVFGGQ